MESQSLQRNLKTHSTLLLLPTMTPTPAMIPTLIGLHLRLLTPASLLKSFHRHNKQSLRRNMLDQNLHNLQQDLTPLKRRNARKLRTELQLSDTGRRKNLNRT